MEKSVPILHFSQLKVWEIFLVLVISLQENMPESCQDSHKTKYSVLRI